MAKASWEDIWNAGNQTSGGFGLWGHSVMTGPKSHLVARVWTEELRKKGYTDVDIVLYGDWKDGRHLGDAFHDAIYEGGPDTMKKMRKAIQRSAESAKEVHRENLDHYATQPDIADELEKSLGPGALKQALWPRPKAARAKPRVRGGSVRVKTYMRKGRRVKGYTRRRPRRR